MYKNLCSILEKPLLYTKTEIPFWDDEHISGEMLKAHLDPDFEGASRKLPFIEKSVRWIGELAPAGDYRRLIDFGCGPGLYGERFARTGYEVTGVDMSWRSIAYAKRSAREKGLDIRYLQKNYLQMDLGETFDFATMIYCDYGALSTVDRAVSMNTVYNHLRPGGRFLLDVFTMVKYELFEEAQTWEVCENGGFWSDQPYIEFDGRYKYPGVTLEHAAIVSGQEVRNYYIWNTYFSREGLTREAEAAGFHVCGLFGDVAGAPYGGDGQTMAVLLEK